MRSRRTILGYNLPLLGKKHPGNFHLDIHEDATILSINEIVDPESRRYYRLALFALVDTYRDIERRHFVVLGTTEPAVLPELWNHVGSVQSRSGYVWHVFEVWQ
jgi:hypothetical protein